MAQQLKEGDAVQYRGIAAIMYVIGTRKTDGYVACWDGIDAGGISFYRPENLTTNVVTMEDA